ncbi:MAG: hypothetical protein ACREE2_10905 [Stellaceae bacterium]
MVDPNPLAKKSAAQTASIRASIEKFVALLPSEIRPTRGDLILGFATGYKPHMIAPFVESVRTQGRFTGKIVLFVDAAARQTADYLAAHDIEAVAFDPSKSPAPQVGVARFFTYFDYLREQWNSGAVFNQILMTDVRDVTFQKPLFGTPCEELEFHLEAPLIRSTSTPNTIHENGLTRKWIEAACGGEAVEALSSNLVSCSGTISGRTRGIFDYLAQMQLLALGLSEAAGSTWGIDQGVHNYILYTGLARSATAKPNFARVATLGLVAGSSLSCDASGRVINPDGEISEIAHQWDRHRHLSKAICAVYLQNRQYGRWRFWMSRVLPRLTLLTRV